MRLSGVPFKGKGAIRPASSFAEDRGSVLDANLVAHTSNLDTGRHNRELTDSQLTLRLQAKAKFGKTDCEQVVAVENNHHNLFQQKTSPCFVTGLYVRSPFLWKDRLRKLRVVVWKEQFVLLDMALAHGLKLTLI